MTNNYQTGTAAPVVAERRRFGFLQLATLVLLLFSLSLFAFQAKAAGAAGEIAIDQMSRSLVAPEATHYQWYFNGQKLEEQNFRGLAVRESGNYRVEYQDASGNQQQQETTIMVTANTIRRIYLIGDSTVTNYNASAYPMTGWGQVLQRFFNSQSVAIVNHAIGGRSSKSFHVEGRWTTVHNLLQPGDFVFIQFGHNDRDWTKPERYADSATFKSYLRIYVNETRAKGATPVLVTPMNMNTWTCTTVREVFRENQNDYRGAMVDVATKMNVPLIDLNIKSRDLMQSVGQAYASRNLFHNLAPGEYPNYPTGSSDGTHFQEMGAIEMAKLVVEGVRELGSHATVGTLVPDLLPLYPVTITSSIPAAGIVTRSSSYPAGVQVTIKGIPKFNSTFTEWKTNDSRVTTNQNYSFTMGAAPRSFSAHFGMTTGGSNELVSGATYKIASQHNDLYLDVTSSSTANGAVVFLNNYSDNPSQRWVLNDVGDGYYSITAVHSNKSLDVEGRSLNDGGRLLQYTTGTGTNQHFRIEPTGDGFYSLKARHSEKCLGITTSTSCANVVQYGCDNANVQKFTFHRISVTSSPSEALVNQIEVFPNPSEKAFQIAAAGKFTYTIYNEVGQVLESGQGSEAVEAGAALKRGLYFIKINTTGSSRVLKLLKQ